MYHVVCMWLGTHKEVHTVVSPLWSPWLVVELDHIVRGEELGLRTRGMVLSRRVYMVRHPQGSPYCGNPTSFSGTGSIRKQIKSVIRRCLPHVRKYAQGAEVRLTSGYS